MPNFQVQSLNRHFISNFRQWTAKELATYVGGGSHSARGPGWPVPVCAHVSLTDLVVNLSVSSDWWNWGLGQKDMVVSRSDLGT